MKTITIGWLNKCRCGNKSHTVKTARGNETALWDDDAVKCNSCGRGGVIQVCEGQARVLWETDEEVAESKPMSTITREQLRERAREKVKSLEFSVTQSAFADSRAELEEELELARIALASLEAEAVAYVDPSAFNNFSVYRAGDTDNKRMGREWMWANPDAGLIPVYTAPPAPSVDEDLLHIAASAIDDLLSNKDRSGAGVWADIPAKLRRAAMLQGAEPVTTAYKLPMQPLVIDAHGTLRFKENPIVRKLLDYATEHGYGLNEIALDEFEAEDQMQLAQLIGYSLSGYGTLSYVTDESYDRAAATAPQQEVK